MKPKFLETLKEVVVMRQEGKNGMAEATKRPWVLVCEYYSDSGEYIEPTIWNTERTHHLATVRIGIKETKANGELIVTAVNERDALLSENAALKAEVERLKVALQRECDRYQDLGQASSDDYDQLKCQSEARREACEAAETRIKSLFGGDLV